MTICNKGTTILSFVHRSPRSINRFQNPPRVQSGVNGLELPHLLTSSMCSLHFLSRHPSGITPTMVLTHSVPSRDHHCYSIIAPIQSRTPHLSRRASSSHSVSLPTATCPHRCQHSCGKRRNRADNSHKAHPRSRSRNRIRPQHANPVDEG